MLGTHFKFFTTLVTQRLWWIAIVGFWALVATFSYQWQYNRLEADAIDMATIRGREVFTMVQITRSWNASHGGIYAKVTPESPENPFLEHPDKNAQTALGKKLTMINPAYMTRQINEMLAKETDMHIHLTSLRPINPGNGPDPWERQALQSFERGVKEQVIIQGNGSAGVFRYMAPLSVKQPCLACHAKQGYHVGQIRGGLSVTQPVSYITGTIDSQKSSIKHIHIGAFLLISSISIFSLSVIRRQIHDLANERDQRKQVADELAIKLDELERARDHLIQTEKQASLGRLAAGFAHEMNTPVGIALSAVTDHAQTLFQLRKLLDQDEVSVEELSGHLDILNQTDQLATSNLHRAADLVGKFKRASIDQASNEERAFDLRELVESVISSYRTEFRNTAINITVDCPHALIIHSAPGLLTQLLGNLLLNSLQHGFDNGARAGNITIGISQDPQDWVNIAYRDDGAGMPAEVVEKAFEPFFTTSRSRGGSGLGLYLSYNIVTAKLGGGITLTSTPGQGSLFSIRFPART